jgi:hypothetical protein
MPVWPPALTARPTVSTLHMQWRAGYPDEAEASAI